MASQKRVSRKAKLISQVRAIRKVNVAPDQPCFEKDAEVQQFYFEQNFSVGTMFIDAHGLKLQESG